MTTRARGAATPPSVPPLTQAERDALTISIKRFGIVLPVVKDQRGDIIDGFNRAEIAEELGIDLRFAIRDCTPEERDILRTELNTMRRQIPAEQWQPLVDHLLSETEHSERVIAKTVGVSRQKVASRKKDLSTGPAGPVDTSKRTTGEDGKSRPPPQDESYADRALHLIREAPDGLTERELMEDEVLKEARNIRGSLKQWKRDGVIYESGKRRGAWVLKPMPEEMIPPRPEGPSKKFLDKVEQVLRDLSREDIREAIKARIDNSTVMRKNLAIVRSYEREDERRAAAQAQEDARLSRVEEEQLLKRNEYWFALERKLQRFHKELAVYIREFDDLPSPHQSVRRGVDRELTDLGNSIGFLQAQLFPGREKGKGSIKGGTIIDIDEHRS